MVNFEQVYARLCELYPNPQELGRRFERIMADVFRTDPVFADRYAAVQSYAEWAGDGGDFGVDLVAERADGEGYAAIQVKCYDPDATLYLDPLSTFLMNTNEQFTERIIVSTTTNWSKNLVRAVENQRPPVQRLYLSDIGTGIDWDACLARIEEQNPPVAMRPSREAMEHQTAALADLRAKFAQHDRGKLIMACGTGKTFTALRAAEEQAGQGGRVLFAAPSISLVARRCASGAATPASKSAPSSSAPTSRSDAARTATAPAPTTFRSRRPPTPNAWPARPAPPTPSG